VAPAACRRRSHAGKPRASRVLFRHRVDYRTVPTTVGHGCTMDADSGATDHAARSRRGTIAARAFRISELGVLSRRLAPGTTPAARDARAGFHALLCNTYSRRKAGRTPSRDASPGRLAAHGSEKCGEASLPRRSGGPNSLMDEPGCRSSVTRAPDEPGPSRRACGESEPHFSGLPTEGSPSEMASGPLRAVSKLSRRRSRLSSSSASPRRARVPSRARRSLRVCPCPRGI
jgi:hypothetical protein